jgi:hypothetical protein
MRSAALASPVFVVALTCTAAHAAGGHFTVDDATIAEPGQCQLETWAESPGAGDARHAGAACRVGAWELGLSADRARSVGGRAATAAGAQAKWVASLTETVGAGLSISPVWQRGRYESTALVLPLTWQAAREWQVHVNAGRQWNRGGPSNALAGIAAEWSPNEKWSVTAERFNDAAGRAVRVGGRWQPTPAFSLDLSRAKPPGDARRGWWTLGATFVGEGLAAR